MATHTLIFETSKTAIPGTEILNFVKDLISNGQIKIDYFNLEMDNGLDYIDEDLQKKLDASTYITFNFETPEAIDYESISLDEIKSLILDRLNNSTLIDLRPDEKDVTINF